MLPKYSHKKSRGFVLVGALSIMIFAGIFGVIGTSMIATTGVTHLNNVESAQAFAIANAGAEWYMGRLKSDTNWTDETTLTRAYDAGSFTITIQSSSASEVTFRSTGTVLNPFINLNVTRYVSMTVQKLPNAFRYALFCDAPSARLRFVSFNQNGTRYPSVINGDVWVNGNAGVDSGNSVLNGKIYLPSNRNVNGGGTYVEAPISMPYPSHPTIDATSYLDAISNFNSLLNSNLSLVDLTISGNFTVSGTMNYRNITVSNNATIVGNGTLVANQSIQLLSNGGIPRTLVVTPNTGGSITFLANQSITVGSGSSSHNITVNNRCTFYSRSLLTSTGRLIVQGLNTNLSNTKLYATRNVLLYQGAKVLNDSLIFINNTLLTGFNYGAQIIGGDTEQTTFEGTLISLLSRTSSVVIEGGAQKTGAIVRGIVYVSPTTTTCTIHRASIYGTVVCPNFNSNQIDDLAITYDSSVFPATLPAGFDGYISRKDNSWDGI